MNGRITNGWSGPPASAVSTSERDAGGRSAVRSADGRNAEPDWREGRGRSGPIACNFIGPEQKCEALEDLAHLGRSQGADSATESRLIDGADLGDVYDAGTRKSRVALPEAGVARHRQAGGSM